MPPLCDSIGSHYDMVKRTVLGKIEQHNARNITSPLLQNPDTQVLDLACDTGFYTRFLVEWGAASVVGVDLSRVMLPAAAAARLTATPYTDRVAFRLGDPFHMPDPVDNSHRPASGEEEEEGVSTSSPCMWLLVYAKDKEELARGFRTVAANLRAGEASSWGFFLAPPPGVEDVAALARSSRRRRRMPTPRAACVEPPGAAPGRRAGRGHDRERAAVARGSSPRGRRSCI
ncbi:toxA protein [Cordyceps fumosorosea ARSEF 2679]|uniref:ToxA protein n=1 Tax=Cordyceps fumosorosea (strain ARSEF 2679) TaxID=1081104 RepID=A0A167XFN1_CORFA|nr:toxA protein [Cordyceps fumosorosea ARSEF 2679]OAA64923.1 toxA protein [Cordyceps fumosorosea ARSEF 2679]